MTGRNGRSGCPGPLPACGFLVRATKGGALPVSVEKRPKGKRVTVIANVHGNAAALSSALGRVLGVGGTVHDRGPSIEVEVQGEQVERVGRVLLQLACVRGLAVSKETAAHVVERDSGHDAALQAGAAEGRRKPRHAASARAPEPPEDAPCRRWHGYWPYCTGSCEEPRAAGRRDAALHGGLWEDAAPPPLRVGWGAATAPQMLDATLSALGLSAEPGAAVREWHARQDDAAAATARRRADPQPSRCAPGRSGEDGRFECLECGAVFGAKATLRKHAMHHQRERAGLTAPAAPEAAADWRRSTMALECNEWGWEDHGRAQAWSGSEGLSDGEDCRAAPVAASASLADYLTAGKARGQRRAQARAPKAAPPTRTAKSDPMAPCPVCDRPFPIASMDAHVEECLLLAAPEEAASSSAAGGGALPPEFLDAFLDMDLPPAAAERFWARYEAGSGGSPEEAFVAALEEALSVEDDGVEPTMAFTEELEEAEDEDVGEDPRDAAVDLALSLMRGGGAKAPPPPPPCGRDDAPEADVRRPAAARQPPARQPPSRPLPPPPAPRSYAEAADRAPLIAHGIAEWLRAALQALVDEDAADSIAVGVEVVLANAAADPDAAENARELVAAQLEGLDGVGQLMAGFDRQLSKLSAKRR